jgi:hypothetical protein
LIEIFDSFADVPLDEPDLDGDDELVPGEYGASYEVVAPRFLLSTAVTTRTMVVPYRRIAPGTPAGLAVVALGRALWRSGYLWRAKGAPIAPQYNRFKREALKKFKREHGLPNTPIYDRATHRLLAEYYDANALSLLHAVKPRLTKEERIRLAIVGAGNFLYNHRYQLAYTQRRAYTVTKIPRLPYPGLDCSAGKAWCDMNAGAPEPSGYSGWGYGNTFSQLDRYQRLGRAHMATSTNVRRAKIGDPIYYRGHVAWIISEGGNTRVWSFGSYPIRILDWNYRGDAVAVCDLLA